MLLLDALRDFLDEQEYKGNSPVTIDYYQSRIEGFRNATKSTNLTDFNEQRIRRWLVSHKGCSRNTLANYDRALRVFANWLYQRGYVTENPMGKLPKPREVETQINPFTPEDVRTMLAFAKKGSNPLRDTALIILLLDTGIRIGEACNLQLGSIQWSEGFINVNGKSGERSVPFGRRAKQALRRYIDRERHAASSRERHVFLSNTGNPLGPKMATQHLIRIARRASVQTNKVGPHNFRHTFSVEFIRAGGDAFTLQRILGHSTLDMTRKYVHLAQTDLRSAHKRFGPGDRFLKE